ncbi:uncharacterized protein LOC128242920 isoform X2 [Mya arenaria]|uniref:uncharacterized protein LOC128242920 isoform X2 n=1 Tax=Mya arenaria TaxID=6604 RepID=UPI0022E68725|nr:uncharacterized protein LOC128242920 isoform X2 [Mya arenaria]
MTKNSHGLRQFHLRRIGPAASKSGVADVMDFNKVTCIIGRSVDKVDYVIDSSSYIQSACLSRCHARVVRQEGNQHTLYDDSLNGVFINNIKISGFCVLREGDRVTFGHPTGVRLPSGMRVRQPDSEHQFMFEACCCVQTDQSDPAHEDSTLQQAHSSQEGTFKKPVNPAENKVCPSAREWRTTRHATKTFTPEDVRKLKCSWEEKQETERSHKRSANESPDDKACGRLGNVECVENGATAVDAVCVNTEHIDTATGNQENVETDLNEAAAPNNRVENPSETGAVAIINVPKNCNVMVESNNDDLPFQENEKVRSERGTTQVLEDKHAESSDIEGAFNSIMKEISAIKDAVSGSDSSFSVTPTNSPVANKSKLKSPTKEVSIQTSQSVMVQFVSPSKDACIQTSQPFLGNIGVQVLADETNYKFSESENPLGVCTAEFDDNEQSGFKMTVTTEMHNISVGTENSNLKESDGKAVVDKEYAFANEKVPLSDCLEEHVKSMSEGEKTDASETDDTFYTCVESDPDMANLEQIVDGEVDDDSSEKEVIEMSENTHVEPTVFKDENKEREAGGPCKSKDEEVCNSETGVSLKFTKDTSGGPTENRVKRNENESTEVQQNNAIGNLECFVEHKAPENVQESKEESGPSKDTDDVKVEIKNQSEENDNSDCIIVSTQGSAFDLTELPDIGPTTADSVEKTSDNNLTLSNSIVYDYDDDEDEKVSDEGGYASDYSDKEKDYYESEVYDEKSDYEESDEDCAISPSTEADEAKEQSKNEHVLNDSHEVPKVDTELKMYADNVIDTAMDFDSCNEICDEDFDSKSNSCHNKNKQEENSYENSKLKTIRLVDNVVDMKSSHCDGKSDDVNTMSNSCDNEMEHSEKICAEDTRSDTVSVEEKVVETYVGTNGTPKKQMIERKRHISAEIAENYGNETERKRRCTGENSNKEEKETTSHMNTFNNLKTGLKKVLKLASHVSYKMKSSSKAKADVYLTDLEGSYQQIGKDEGGEESSRHDLPSDVDCIEPVKETMEVFEVGEHSHLGEPVHQTIDPQEINDEKLVETPKDQNDSVCLDTNGKYSENEVMSESLCEKDESVEDKDGYVSAATSIDTEENCALSNVSQEKDDTHTATCVTENEVSFSDASEMKEQEKVASHIFRGESVSGTDDDAETDDNICDESENEFSAADDHEKESATDISNTAIDKVEDSVCYTDDDMDSDNEIMHTSWLKPVSETPSKVRGTAVDLEATFMSPVLKCMDAECHGSKKTQSPVIDRISSNTPIKVKKIDLEDTTSVLSCQFSDDENDDIPTNYDFDEIDFEPGSKEQATIEKDHEQNSDRTPQQNNDSCDSDIDGGTEEEASPLDVLNDDDDDEIQQPPAKESNMDVAFDFCDTESDSEFTEIKQYNGDKQNKSVKRKLISDESDKEMSQSVKAIRLNNESTVKQSTPRKTSSLKSITEFKSPQSIVITRKDKEHHKSFDSPSGLCTQLLDVTQTADLDDLSMTQVSEVKEQLKVKASDTSRPSSSRSKAKDLLEKLRAKMQLKEERLEDDYPSSSPTAGPSTEIEIYNRHQTEAQRELAYVDRHVNSCRTVISELKEMFDGQPTLHSHPRVQAWRQELADVEKRLTFPKTVIAVVGNTGAGKSSLMNAVLDHRSVLPTSGMRACTAVVVEVVQNTTSNSFEADIEFLQRKEWFDELQILLKDLTGLDGKIKKNVPDPASDAYVSYCKVKAVYGRIDSFEILSRIITVTNWLGRVRVIKANNPEAFRRQVEKYIETQDPGAGGQYWPIVKHVRLRMPKCDVCSSGAALVDLPGVRDSNAARDKIAREYLKNCTAVWVVSSIHRAIDDKTAKDLLGENFRRQLLMDGQYGSIAFICTKTDVITPSEIIRSLKLEEKTKEYEDKVETMEAEKVDLDLKIANGNNEVRGLKKSIAALTTEAKELRLNLAEIGSLLEPAEEEQTEEHEALQEYEEELKSKEALIGEHKARMEELLDQKQEASQKILSLDKTLNIERKMIAAICALARNDYSRSQIKRDFKAGLREMKRRAGMLVTDDPEEEEDLYDDDSGDDDDDIGSTADNLRVFCCSSTEYQKMRNLLKDDGPPQVFSDLTDTQIPALRNYVHEMTSIRQRQSVDRLIHNLGRVVFDMHIYTSEGENTCARGGQDARYAIENELKRLDTNLGPVLQKLSADIDGIFDGSVRPKMEEGASTASAEANNTCAKWGAPFIRDKTKDRREGGLHFMTYKATTRRNGVYTSPTFGPVDFNEDLAEPMYRSMTIVWDRAFSGMLWRVMEGLKTDLMALIQDFTDGLQRQLELLGIAAIRTDRLAKQVMGSAQNKLTEMVSYLKDIVTTRQRDISRIVTPHIQTKMLDEYGQCAAESGSGMFVRMKTYMAQGIDNKRASMFDEATHMLMEQLMDLQTELVQYVKGVVASLITDLRRAFEPLWEDPSNSYVVRQAFAKALDEFTDKMRVIYREAGIQNTDERHIIPAPTQRQPGGAAQGSGSVTCVAGVTGDFTVTRQPEWQTFSKTIYKKEDTSYGSHERYGEMGVRVKTELVSNNCLKETMETVSRVHTLHIKQEKQTADTSSTDASLMTFGQQTLNDLHQGRLEVSPMDVVVKSSPAAKSLLHYKTVSHAAATFSGPPANKSIGKENHSAYNQAKVILVPSGKAPSSHIASLQTSREQVPSLFSTGRSQSTNMYCTEPAPSGGKGKGPGKGKGTMSSLLLSKMTTPIQTTPTVTVKTEPPDTGYSARLKRANKYLYIDLTEDD